MRAFLSALVIVSFGFAILGQDVKRGSTKREKRPAFVPNEILVKFEPARQREVSAVANRGVGAAKLENLGESGWERIQIPDGMTVEQALEHYRAVDGVEAAQPNFYYHPLAAANDVQFNTLYGLSKISAPSAWDLTTGSSNVVVAVIDSGIRYTHEDLAANIWVNPGEIAGNGVDDDANGFVDDIRGWDFRFNDNDPIDLDSGISSAHGTHTAGTIGAVGNNLIGVTGVNWNVKILNIKIFNNTVWDDTTSAMLVNAYNYVRMMKNRGVNIRVTSNSYGGCTEACGYDQATKDAIDAMGDSGILNVFSAGNDASNSDAVPSYPASYNSPSIVSVAASDSSDLKAGFSNYGATAVDLAAPGVSINSTVPAGHGYLSGTSMAGPHVAGAAALLSAFNPNLSPASLKATLLNTVDPLAQWAGVVKTGGRLNVDRALRNQTVCSYNVATQQINVSKRGGYGFVNVTAGSNCDFAIRNNVKWLSVGEVGSGSSSVMVRVGFNRTNRVRTGSIQIAGQTINITQK